MEGINVASTPNIEVDSIDHEHLAAFLEEQSSETGPVHRVGRYFEQLVHYWLQHVRGLEIVATGMQLKDDKITVGEIDFLYRDEQDALVHCEASIKYFLCHPPSEPSCYPGPNARDNYERKVTKLFDKQLLASVGRVDDVEHRLGLVKGMIFYHPNEPEVARPERLPTGHQRGAWHRFSEMNETMPDPENLFAIVTKPHWLAPVAGADLVDFDTFHRHLDDHFGNVGHPLLVTTRSPADPETEVQRHFVVSGEWPNT